MSPVNGGFFTFVIVTRVQPRGRMPAAKREMLRDKLARDLLPTIARSCTFWGVVQSVNFRFVPLRLQVLFSSSAAGVADVRELGRQQGCGGRRVTVREQEF